MVEVERDRRLDQSRADRCLARDSAHIGETPGELGALGEQQLDSFDGDVVPRDAAAPPRLLGELQASGVGVQRVWYEMTT
jgi:hypothetical protein